LGRIGRVPRELLVAHCLESTCRGLSSLGLPLLRYPIKLLTCSHFRRASTMKLETCIARARPFTRVRLPRRRGSIEEPSSPIARSRVHQPCSPKTTRDETSTEILDALASE
jgi:hypothetical protein